jgi:hypothetical protein
VKIFLAGGTGVVGVRPGAWAATAADIPDDGPKVGVDHAAAATVAHLLSPTGIYTITD